MTTYTIRGGAEDKRRLIARATVGPTTKALLAEIGIRPGSTCVDLGWVEDTSAVTSPSSWARRASRGAGLRCAVKLAAARRSVTLRCTGTEFRAADVAQWADSARTISSTAGSSCRISRIVRGSCALRRSTPAEGVLAFEDF
jgi:hypothetical protein